MLMRLAPNGATARGRQQAGETMPRVRPHACEAEAVAPYGRLSLAVLFLSIGAAEGWVKNRRRALVVPK
jgi:hypothetical protein